MPYSYDTDLAQILHNICTHCYFSSTLSLQSLINLVMQHFKWLITTLIQCPRRFWGIIGYMLRSVSFSSLSLSTRSESKQWHPINNICKVQCAIYNPFQTHFAIGTLESKGLLDL